MLRPPFPVGRTFSPLSIVFLMQKTIGPSRYLTLCVSDWQLPHTMMHHNSDCLSFARRDVSVILIPVAFVSLFELLFFS